MGKKPDENKQPCMVSESELRLSEINDTVLETLEILGTNDEWIDRYRDYAKVITDNLDSIKQARKNFHEWSPLKFYLNVTNAKNASSSMKLGIRYRGQEVAELIFNKKKSNVPILNTVSKDKEYDRKNADYFDCPKSLDKVDWQGADAKEFRAFFKKELPRNDSAGNKNEEHRIESLLLSEFSKSRSQDKTLLYIQPVKIAGIRFPMPTPISASNHEKIKYSKDKGGGIDILTRVGKGYSAKLCIIELKDENKPDEPPISVIKQAVAYTVFIRELLRSESGNNWWRLFGFSKSLPQKLVLYAVCAMPSGMNNDYSFANNEIRIGEDVIQLHYMYFHETNNSIGGIESSLDT